MPSSTDASREVIVPDVNLVLYAEIDAHRLHAPDHQWWEGALLTDPLQVGEAGLASKASHGRTASA
jgi:hypothetical protein